MVFIYKVNEWPKMGTIVAAGMLRLQWDGLNVFKNSFLHVSIYINVQTDMQEYSGMV